jgi:tRNA threonylcarbamoyladenosine biosynthesis protein TsaE
MAFIITDMQGKRQKKMIKETSSPEQTFAFARSLGERAEAGQIYTLNGDLGAGKTVFAQGMAAGLGITDPVTSPTFTIVQEYAGGRLPLYHFDVYRIEEPEEMEEVGFDDYLYGDGICLIEWAEQVRELLPENIISVTITKNPEKGFSYRKIELEGLSE